MLKKEMDRWFDVVGIMEPLDEQIAAEGFVSGRELESRGRRGRTRC